MRYLFSLLLLPLTACGGTEGGYTELDVRVQADLPTEANGYGWQFDLTRAQLSFGPLRMHEGAPLHARVAKEVFHLVFGMREAHAHPGHYHEGAALAEWLGAQTVDLLSPAPVDLGTAMGVTGEYRSASLSFPPSPALDAATLVIEGTAQRGEARITFTATVADAFEVVGIPAQASITAPTAKVILHVDLPAWLERMDLEGHAGGPLVKGTAPHNALVRSITHTSAFRFEFEVEPTENDR